VSGTVAQLRAILNGTHAAGELVSLTPPTSADGGQTFTTYVELRADQRATTQTLTTHRSRVLHRRLVIASVALATSGTILWGLYELTLWVRAHAHLLLGVAFVAVVILAALARPIGRICGCLLTGLVIGSRH
jgi:hypothetical protein